MPDEMRSSVIDGVGRLNELVRNMNRSSIFAQEHGAALDSITSVHQQMTRDVGQGDSGDPETMSLKALADAYSKDAQTYGKFLQLLHEAVKRSAPLSQFSPSKGMLELAIHEDRINLMTHLADQNARWLSAYRNFGDAALTRRERATLAEAFGGASIGSSPINRLLGSAGEIIDLMEDLPDDVSRQKAAWLAAEYDVLESRYGFDPSAISTSSRIVETKDGNITHTKISWWNTMEQREEGMTISTAPGESPMPTSHLIESAAQARWASPQLSEGAGRDVSLFCRSVLERSLPERLEGSPAGERMEMLSKVVEQAMGRYSPGIHESWLQGKVTATRVEPMERAAAEAYFTEHGYSTGVGDDGLIAMTPDGAATPVLARYLPENGVMLITEYETGSGMEHSLTEVALGVPLHEDKYVSEANQSPMQVLAQHIRQRCEYLDDDSANSLARLMAGEMSPEDVPATAQWIRDCYNRPSYDELVKHAANDLLDGFGVEMIYSEDFGDGEAPCIEYINVGESYTPTLLWHDGELYLSSWADMVEAIEQRQADEKEGVDWSKMPFKTPHPMPKPLGPLIDEVISHAVDHQGFAGPEM